MPAAQAVRTKSVPIERIATGVPVQVAGETIYIGPLSLDQWVRLTHAAIPALQNMPKGTIEKLQAMSAKDPDIPTLVQAILGLLDTETVSNLYGALIDRDTAWVKKHFRLAEFVTVIAAVKENGELGEVVSAFDRVVKGW